MKIIFDTNIWVNAFSRSNLWEKIKADWGTETDLVSCLVIQAEILALAERRNWGQPKKDAINKAMLKNEVIGLNSEIVSLYVELDYYCYNKSRVLGKNDLWIAAIAMYANATLITADKDFNILGGDKINLIEYNVKDFTSMKKMKK